MVGFVQYVLVNFGMQQDVHLNKLKKESKAELTVDTSNPIAGSAGADGGGGGPEMGGEAAAGAAGGGGGAAAGGAFEE